MNWGYWIVFTLVFYGLIGFVVGMDPSGQYGMHHVNFEYYTWSEGEYGWDDSWNFQAGEDGEMHKLLYPYNLSAGEQIWIKGRIRDEDPEVGGENIPLYTEWNKRLRYDIKIRVWDAVTGEQLTTKTYEFIPESTYFWEENEYFRADFYIHEPNMIMTEHDYYFTVEAYERDIITDEEALKEAYGGVIQGDMDYTEELAIRTPQDKEMGGFWRVLEGIPKSFNLAMEAGFPFNIILTLFLVTPFAAMATYAVIYHARPGYWLFGGG